MTHRLARLGVLVVAAAFVGYWALLAYCDLARPLPPGLLLSFDSGRVTVLDVVAGSAAAESGLSRDDRILSMGGQPITGRMHWLSVEANLEYGRPTALVIDRHGASSTIAFVPERGSWPSWRAQHGPELLVIRGAQLVTLLLAAFVSLRRPGDASALVGSAFLATMGIFSITLPFGLASTWRALPFPADWLLWIPFINSVAVAGWGLSFFTIFPRRRYGTRLVWLVIWSPLVPGLIGQAIFGYHMVVLRQPPPPLPPWAEPLIAISVVYIVAMFVVLVRNYRELTDLNERRRVRVLALGSLVASLGGVPVFVSYWFGSRSDVDRSFLASPFATFGTFLFLLLPLSFVYAILRHRLFDVRLMIRQGLRYAVARRALLALVPLLIAAFSIDLLAHGNERVGDVLLGRLWIYAAVAGLAVAARTQRQTWLDALDRRFFRERYNAQRLLRQVAEDVRRSAGLEPAAPMVVSRIDQALHPTFVALLVCDQAAGVYRAIASSPEHAVPRPLDTGNKMLALMRLLGKPLEIVGSETEWLARKMPIGDIRSLQSAAIDLLVPVAAGNTGADALLVLGPKRSEEPYTDDDSELLMAIAESVAMRLPRAPADAQTVADGFEECPTCGGCYESGTGRCRTEGAALVRTVVPRVLGGRYQLERRLGQGGMGTVYAAFDRSLDRRVAAKVIRADLSGLPGALERFQKEARVAAAFSHANVVTVHDFGVAGAHAFLVMEFLDGRTLRETLRAERRFEPVRALDVVRDVAAAVEAAHRRQLVHRDLKPENICLVPHGSRETAKVLDFGIAKFLAGADQDPLTFASGGALVGTPMYMAPEQLRGESPEPSWDIWALAVITFEMLTGSHPFAAAAIGLHAAVPAASVDLPKECRPFFSRALAIDRAARPQSPAEFLDGFEESLFSRDRNAKCKMQNVECEM